MYSSRIYLFIGFFAFIAVSVSAQTDKEKYEAFKKQAVKKYTDFRDKANKDYADFMKQAWATFEASSPRPIPKEKPVPPVVMPEEDRFKIVESVPLSFKEVIMPPAPKPQPLPLAPIKEFPLPVAPVMERPQPLEPIKEQPQPLDTIVEQPQPQDSFVVPQLPIDSVDGAPLTLRPVQDKPLPDVPIIGISKMPTIIKLQPRPIEKRFAFKFYGTEAKVRLDEQMRFKMDGVEEECISNAWTFLANNKIYDNLIRDCLELRITLGLSDWAYLHMLQDMAEAFYGKDTNEATLLMAYVYCQSGYQMRLGQNEGRLYMLYASQHYIYNVSYFQIDGQSFYPYGYDGTSLRICKAAFPKEQPLSLYVTASQKFAPHSTERRTLQSKRYSDMSVDVQVNQNLIDFYSSYPYSELNNNFMTCWAIYAETPLDEQIKESLYPSLKKHLEGLPKREAAERLLNWVQTALDYEYDEKVWGADRIFFAEESLFYPFCDCEDRSILLTRLYRDLLGLKCLLVYYPGHLATAVLLPGEQSGDYIELNGDKYTVADPTYIGANIGRTMPGMNNKEATVILLN